MSFSQAFIDRPIATALLMCGAVLTGIAGYLLLLQLAEVRVLERVLIEQLGQTRLRRKVDMPGETPLIHTVRGIGFVLRAPA